MQEASSKQQTKQKYKLSNQQTGLPPHSALPIRGKTNKNSAKISPYRKLTQTTGPILGGHKLKGRQNSNFFKQRIQLSLKPGKGDLTSNIITLKKIKKRQRNTAKMKEQTRNREVQISEEEIGKLPEKEFRLMIVKMIKNLEKTKWRVCKNQLIKT